MHANEGLQQPICNCKPSRVACKSMHACWHLVGYNSDYGELPHGRYCQIWTVTTKIYSITARAGGRLVWLVCVSLSFTQGLVDASGSLGMHA